MTKKVTMSLSVDSKHLLDAIARVKPFACTDETIPAINAIRLDYKPEHGLAVVATDRFILGVQSVYAARSETGENLESFGVTIPLGQLPIVQATAKCSRRVLISPTERDHATIAGYIVKPDDTAGYAVGIDHPMPWPDWRGMVRNFDQADRLRRARPRVLGRSPISRQAATHPANQDADSIDQSMIATDGDNFIGLLMPVRGAREELQSVSERIGVAA